MPAELQHDVAALVEAMEIFAPTAHAEPWDNVGLLLGDPAADLRGGVLLCIDLTHDVLGEAAGMDAGAVVAYHPPVFQELKRIVAGEAKNNSGLTFEILRRGISVYSPHTAMDVCVGGTNDVLADALYVTDRHALKPRPAAEDGHLKLVVFVPSEAADAVADAVFNAGGGTIGRYDRCSFRTAGTGTFRGGEGTNPTVGSPGVDERADEVRLETVIPAATADAVVAAMKRAHPYEEVAFDLMPRRRSQDDRVGLGRIGTFDEPVPREVLIGRVRRELGVSDVLVAGPVDGEVKRVACCAGSCGDLWQDARRAGAEFYLTGEMRHHDALAAAAAGMTVVCVLHSNSERAALEPLRRQLAKALPNVEIRQSELDRDPFRIV
jgi:dinuclear metal center YbgI/SA1388 family protein